MSVLVVTPRHDPSSRECARWADSLVKKHAGKLATLSTRSRSSVDQDLTSHQHVFYFGHGETDHLIVPAGFIRKRVVLLDEDNLRGTPDRIVVAVACWSGDSLGSAVVTADSGKPQAVSAYVGWLDDVGWPAEWPGPVGEAIVAALDAFCSEGDVSQLVIDLKGRFDVAHDEYRANGARLDSDRVFFGKACALYWRDRLVCFGTPSATL
jgi:hypothetical protein